MVDNLHVPGRLRVTAERFRRRPRACDEAAAQAAAIEGVLATSANPVTAGLVIRYERARLSPERLWQALAAWGIVSGPSPLAEGPLVTRTSLARTAATNPESQLFATLSGIVLDKLMERSAAYLIAALV